MKESTFYGLILTQVLIFISLHCFSQESIIKAEDVTRLQVDKREVIHSQKNNVGPATFWKDSVVYGFSLMTTTTSKYYSLRRIGEFGKFKNLLLDCTVGHDLSHKHAKGAVSAKYTRKVSWVLAFGGMIPFLITFYDNPNFENQKMRWTGGGIMIAGFLSVALSQKVYENKIVKTCRTF